jgi:hypothetical protein
MAAAQGWRRLARWMEVEDGRVGLLWAVWAVRWACVGYSSLAKKLPEGI